MHHCGQPSTNSFWHRLKTLSFAADAGDTLNCFVMCPRFNSWDAIQMTQLQSTALLHLLSVTERVTESQQTGTDSQEFHLGGGGINFNFANFAKAHTGTISKNNQ